jgi:hypothetical protein
MNPVTLALVPKVHPLTRDVEPEDPMELVATRVRGDPDVMLECMVQEFAWMGWDEGQLLELFRSPEYPVLNQLLAHFGEAAIRTRVGAQLDQMGVFHVSETIAPDPEPEEEHEPELIEVGTHKVAGNRA